MYIYRLFEIKRRQVSKPEGRRRLAKFRRPNRQLIQQRLHVRCSYVEVCPELEERTPLC
jgi:hypothetical protein